MADALRPVETSSRTSPGVLTRLSRPLQDLAWLRGVPYVSLALFLLPVAAGFVGTLLPAFGFLPVLGGTSISLAPWSALAATPGLGASILLSLWTGLAATALALLLAVLTHILLIDTGVDRVLRRHLAPIIGMPHAAIAIGLAFLLAPSGWLVRLISPELTGWQAPPDIATIGDRWGLALILALIVKEKPFLILAIYAALAQTRARESLMIARSLGYSPGMAWLKTVFPLIYPQIRLPIFAVLAFSASNVDMALILGPTTPPPLAVRLLGWFNDPDLWLRFKASAGAVLQTGLVLAMILAWWLGERGVAWLARPWLAGGRRGPGSRRPGGQISRVLAAVPVAGIMALTVLAIAVLAIWSFARSWFYPAALPTAWTLDTWIERAGQLAFPAWITVSVAVTAAVAAVLLALANLENERHHDVSMSRRALWLLYLPLLLPQIGFLFGLQTLLVLLDIDGTWLALTAAHLIFVFPYVMIMLADPYRALDPRYGRTARCLGRPPWQTWLRITIPLLLRAISFAFAIGFAVSAAQYLPTIFAGAGRLVTLTTEAVTLASGQDRRIIGAYAIAQSALPWLVLVLALVIPTWLYRHRAGMRESSA